MREQPFLSGILLLLQKSALKVLTRLLGQMQTEQLSGQSWEEKSAFHWRLDMSKSKLLYIADLKNLEEHEEELRVASLSAEQAKIVVTMLVCYPNAMEDNEITAIGQLFKSLATNVDNFLKAERERFENSSEVRP
ncbi:hypothetical protein [Escherichia coli]